MGRMGGIADKKKKKRKSVLRFYFKLEDGSSVMKVLGVVSQSLGTGALKGLTPH